MKGKILKRILVIFIISLMSIVLKNCCSYGVHSTGIDTKIKWYSSVDTKETSIESSQILSDLQANFGYSGTEILDTMKLTTKVTIMDKGDSDNYWLTIGENPSSNGANLMGADGSTTGPGTWNNYRIFL